MVGSWVVFVAEGTIHPAAAFVEAGASGLGLTGDASIPIATEETNMVPSLALPGVPVLASPVPGVISGLLTVPDFPV